jgi:hypothetical protein
MNTKSYIFAGIMSAVIGNAYAVGENTVTSKSYVDSTFQTKIPAKTITELAGNPVQINLVSTTNVPGQVGQVAIYGGTYDGEPGEFSETEWADIFGNYNNYLAADAAVPSLAEMWIENADLESMINYRQVAIPQSGMYSSVGADGSDTGGGSISGTTWLEDFIKGTGLVTKTDTDGNVGERKIFEATDVSGYHAQALSQTEKDIQDISIPTVGAMMTAISNGVNAATPTGTANTIANYDANGALGSGIATANAPTYNNGSLTNGTNIATIAAVDTAMNTREAKMTCAGWPDDVPVADRGNSNCWLWAKN